jgi:hypothetical protein
MGNGALLGLSSAEIELGDMRPVLGNANLYITSLHSAEGPRTRIAGDWGHENVLIEGKRIAPWVRRYRVYVRADHEQLEMLIGKVSAKLREFTCEASNEFRVDDQRVFDVVRDVLSESSTYNPVHEFRNGRWILLADREQRLRHELHLSRERRRSTALRVVLVAAAALVVWYWVR